MDAQCNAVTAGDIVEHAVRLFRERGSDGVEVVRRRRCREVQAAASWMLLFFRVWIDSKPSNSG
jgi:hypothetical protein